MEDKESIAQAADILRRGGLLAIPTETVYGLGANGLDETAVLHIFEAKGRPQDNPLILHIPDASWLTRYCEDVPDAAYKLAERFWPGPLTMVMPRGPEVSDVTCAGLDTVGVPGQKAAASFLARSGTSETIPFSISMPQICTMSGLSCGRPFASKIFLTASPLRASAAMP